MKSIVTSLAVAATWLSKTATLAVDKTLLITPITFATALPDLSSPNLRVAEQMGLMSGGTLKMKVHEPGKLVPTFEILDAFVSGKINSGNTTARYWAGKIRVAVLCSAVPLGPETSANMAWHYYGYGMTLYQERLPT